MTTFLRDIKGKKTEKFFDSNTGKLLFTAPIDRSWDDWIKESKHHGWPSFRDNEVNWENVRVLPNGETVSIDGTHLVSRTHTVIVFRSTKTCRRPPTDLTQPHVSPPDISRDTTCQTGKGIVTVST